MATVLSRYITVQSQQRREIIAMVQGYLNETQAGEGYDFSATCGSELGSLSISCNPEAEARIAAFVERTAATVDVWSSVGTLSTFHDGSVGFELVIDVTGMSDAARIRRGPDHRFRNQQIEEVYDRFVREYGPPVDADGRLKLNQRLACIRGYEIMSRLRGVLDRLNRSPAPHFPPRLVVRCVSASSRGPDYRGAMISASARLLMPSVEGERAVGRLQSAGFLPIRGN